MISSENKDYITEMGGQKREPREGELFEFELDSKTRVALDIDPSQRRASLFNMPSYRKWRLNRQVKAQLPKQVGEFTRGPKLQLPDAQHHAKQDVASEFSAVSSVEDWEKYLPKPRPVERIDISVENKKFARVHNMKEAARGDEDRTKATSVVPNLQISEEVREDNLFFQSKQPEEPPLTQYLDADKVVMQQMPEPYNPQTHAFSLGTPPHLQREHRELYQELLPEKYHGTFLARRDYQRSLEINYGGVTEERMKEKEEEAALQKLKAAREHDLLVLRHRLLTDRQRLYEYKKLNKKLEARKKEKIR